jgi:hypothetical protein
MVLLMQSPQSSQRGTKRSITFCREAPGDQLLSDAAGIELVMQGAASTAITNAAGSLTQLQAIANLFTWMNLDHLITQAQTETQNPGQDLGPIAFDGSAATDQTLL